jgi:hypothetical protein
LLALLSDWMASDPNQPDASLHDFAGVADCVGSVSTVDELRAGVDHFARILLGYDPATGEYLARLHPGRERVSSLAAVIRAAIVCSSPQCYEAPPVYERR